MFMTIVKALYKNKSKYEAKEFQVNIFFLSKLLNIYQIVHERSKTTLKYSWLKDFHSLHPRKIVGNSGVSSQTGKEGQKHSKAQNIFCYRLKMNKIASVLS